MMQFRTEIKTKSRSVDISYDDQILAYGSCFSEHIGNRFKDRMFHSCVNPTGIVFNPIVMAENMRMLLNGERTELSDISELNGKYFSFDYHSVLSASSKASCLALINAKEDEMYEELCHADFIFITFGSAWAYRLNESQQLVANCHKVPQAAFTKELATVEQIFESFEDCLNQLEALNPTCKIVLTVSPVRHWKDGAVENSRSKAHLITACHQLKDKFEQVDYFHAYELMMDDLRDYRFYKSDMLHPSDEAVQYVWEKFCAEFLSSETMEKTLIAEKMLKLQAHNSMSGNTDQAIESKFLELKRQFEA